MVISLTFNASINTWNCHGNIFSQMPHSNCESGVSWRADAVSSVPWSEAVDEYDPVSYTSRAVMRELVWASAGGVEPCRWRSEPCESYFNIIFITYHRLRGPPLILMSIGEIVGPPWQALQIVKVNNINHVPYLLYNSI